MAMTENLAQPQYCIILASLFAAEAMIAATTRIVKDNAESGYPALKSRLKQGMQKVQNVWYTTNKYSQYTPFPDILEGLGKAI